MSTINDVLSRVEQMRPSQYDQKTRAEWLLDFERKLCNEFFQSYEGAEEWLSPPEQYPEDGDKVLMIPDPYGSIYDLFLCSMLDYWNRDWNAYNGSAALYSSALGEFKRWWHRTHRLKPSRAVLIL